MGVRAAAAAAVLTSTLSSFHDLGLVGASATKARRLGGTDHTSFNRAGLPGVNFDQDLIEYNTHTHHTNLDTYERVVEEDARTSAIAIAATAYQLAMSDELLPRLPKEQMPALPGGHQHLRPHRRLVASSGKGVGRHFVSARAVFSWRKGFKATGLSPEERSPSPFRAAEQAPPLFRRSPWSRISRSSGVRGPAVAERGREAFRVGAGRFAAAKGLQGYRSIA